ncbi:MAG: hypothetical protein M3Y85_13270, partial [Bacteroidota bacterium]|nr:hypothetical protein [Bacteroidota bacterium]
NNPIDGYKLSQAITGDQYAKTVTWLSESNLSKLSGNKVKLRFYLKGGNLFSYWVNPNIK